LPPRSRPPRRAAWPCPRDLPPPRWPPRCRRCPDFGSAPAPLRPPCRRRPRLGPRLGLPLSPRPRPGPTRSGLRGPAFAPAGSSPARAPLGPAPPASRLLVPGVRPAERSLSPHPEAAPRAPRPPAARPLSPVSWPAVVGVPGGSLPLRSRRYAVADRPGPLRPIPRTLGAPGLVPALRPARGCGPRMGPGLRLPFSLRCRPPCPPLTRRPLAPARPGAAAPPPGPGPRPALPLAAGPAAAPPPPLRVPPCAVAPRPRVPPRCRDSPRALLPPPCLRCRPLLLSSSGPRCGACRFAGSRLSAAPPSLRPSLRRALRRRPRRAPPVRARWTGRVALLACSAPRSRGFPPPLWLPSRAGRSPPTLPAALPAIAPRLPRELALPTWLGRCACVGLPALAAPAGAPAPSPVGVPAPLRRPPALPARCSRRAPAAPAPAPWGACSPLAVLRPARCRWSPRPPPAPLLRGARLLPAPRLSATHVSFRAGAALVVLAAAVLAPPAGALGPPAPLAPPRLAALDFSRPPKRAARLTGVAGSPCSPPPGRPPFAGPPPAPPSCPGRPGTPPSGSWPARVVASCSPPPLAPPLRRPLRLACRWLPLPRGLSRALRRPRPAALAWLLLAPRRASGWAPGLPRAVDALLPLAHGAGSRPLWLPGGGAPRGPGSVWLLYRLRLSPSARPLRSRLCRSRLVPGFLPASPPVGRRLLLPPFGPRAPGPSTGPPGPPRARPLAARARCGLLAWRPPSRAAAGSLPPPRAVARPLPLARLLSAALRPSLRAALCRFPPAVRARRRAGRAPFCRPRPALVLPRPARSRFAPASPPLLPAALPTSRLSRSGARPCRACSFTGAGGPARRRPPGGRLPRARPRWPCLPRAAPPLPARRSARLPAAPPPAALVRVRPPPPALSPRARPCSLSPGDPGPCPPLAPAPRLGWPLPPLGLPSRPGLLPLPLWGLGARPPCCTPPPGVFAARAGRPGAAVRPGLALVPRRPPFLPGRDAPCCHGPPALPGPRPAPAPALPRPSVPGPCLPACRCARARLATPLALLPFPPVCVRPALTRPQLGPRRLVPPAVARRGGARSRLPALRPPRRPRAAGSPLALARPRPALTSTPAPAPPWCPRPAPRVSPRPGLAAALRPVHSAPGVPGSAAALSSPRFRPLHLGPRPVPPPPRALDPRFPRPRPGSPRSPLPDRRFPALFPPCAPVLSFPPVHPPLSCLFPGWPGGRACLLGSRPAAAPFPFPLPTRGPAPVVPRPPLCSALPWRARGRPPLLSPPPLPGVPAAWRPWPPARAAPLLPRASPRSAVAPPTSRAGALPAPLLASPPPGPRLLVAACDSCCAAPAAPHAPLCPLRPVRCSDPGPAPPRWVPCPHGPACPRCPRGPPMSCPRPALRSRPPCGPCGGPFARPLPRPRSPRPLRRPCPPARLPGSAPLPPCTPGPSRLSGPAFSAPSGSRPCMPSSPRPSRPRSGRCSRSFSVGHRSGSRLRRRLPARASPPPPPRPPCGCGPLPRAPVGRGWCLPSARRPALPSSAPTAVCVRPGRLIAVDRLDCLRRAGFAAVAAGAPVPRPAPPLVPPLPVARCQFPVPACPAAWAPAPSPPSPSRRAPPVLPPYLVSGLGWPSARRLPSPHVSCRPPLWAWDQLPRAGGFVQPASRVLRPPPLVGRFVAAACWFGRPARLWCSPFSPGLGVVPAPLGRARAGGFRGRGRARARLAGRRLSRPLPVFHAPAPGPVAALPPHACPPGPPPPAAPPPPPQPPHPSPRRPRRRPRCRGVPRGPPSPRPRPPLGPPPPGLGAALRSAPRPLSPSAGAARRRRLDAGPRRGAALVAVRPAAPRRGPAPAPPSPPSRPSLLPPPLPACCPGPALAPAPLPPPAPGSPGRPGTGSVAPTPCSLPSPPRAARPSTTGSSPLSRPRAVLARSALGPQLVLALPFFAVALRPRARRLRPRSRPAFGPPWRRAARPARGPAPPAPFQVLAALGPSLVGLASLPFPPLLAAWRRVPHWPCRVPVSAGRGRRSRPALSPRWRAFAAPRRRGRTAALLVAPSRPRASARSRAASSLGVRPRAAACRPFPW